MNETGEYDNGVVEVPYEALSKDALQGLIEEYISREGTDYGAVEISMEKQSQRALGQLQSKQVVILFFPKTEHCQIVRKEDVNAYQSGNLSDHNA